MRMSLGYLWARRRACCVLLLASCSVALGACSTSAESQLAGRWVGSSVESLDGSVSAARAGWAKGTSLTFSGSRLEVRVSGEAPREGAYVISAEDDGKLELAITGHDGHVDRAELIIETDELLRWRLTPVHTLVMQRE